MKIFSSPLSGQYLLKTLVCLAFSVALITAVTSQAAERHNQGKAGQRSQQSDKDWNNHERGAHRYWNRPYSGHAPAVVYAPPVIYSPPPVYEEPGISLIFPLHIR